MLKFPMIDSLGLLTRELHTDGTMYVRAEDLERVLAEGVEVFGTNLADSGQCAGPTPQWFFSLKREDKDTHTGLIINSKPIQKDTAESLLKEYLDSYTVTAGSPVYSWYQRAKRLVGG